MNANYAARIPGPSGDLNGWAEALRQKAGELRQDINDKQLLLAEVEERLNLVNRLIALDGDARNSPANDTKTTTQPKDLSDAPNQGEAQHFEESVASLLANVGRPTHISDIRKGLIERGVSIPGRGEESNIIVRISQDPRFNRTARGTYALTEWGIPSMKASSRNSRRRRPASKR